MGGEREGGDDGGFFAEDGEGEEDGDDRAVCANSRRRFWVEVEGEGPEGEGGGEDVGVGEGGLGVPDGVGGGEDGDGGGGEFAEEAAGEAVDGEQGGGGDEADEGAGAAGDVAGDVPGAGEEERGQRRVGVGDGGLRDQGAGAEEVQRGGDVIAAFVPEVGEAEESEVAKVDRDEEERVENRECDGFGCAWSRDHVSGRALGDDEAGRAGLAELSSEMAPKVCSYCAMLWVRTLSRALACWGLR